MNTPTETLNLRNDINARHSVRTIAKRPRKRGDRSFCCRAGNCSDVMVLLHRLLPWHERYSLPPRQITMRLAKSTAIASEMNEDDERVQPLLRILDMVAPLGEFKNSRR